MFNITQINWQKINNLLPVIVQHATTCEVLMLGYMNPEALEKTLAEKKVTFFSRTKNRLWTKGETSGNFLHVVDMRLEKLLKARKGADPETSYTAQLYARGTKRIAQKVGEEGVETALAATVKDRNETICEAADLAYHLTVLLQDADLSWADVIGKLKERHAK